MNDYERLSLRKFKIKSMVQNATVLLLGRRRCLAKGTEILMYNGDVCKVEDICVGDEVMGDDSTIRTVLDTHCGVDKLYKISHMNGESYVVNSGHILSLMYTVKPYMRECISRGYYQVVWFNRETFKLNYKSFSYLNVDKTEVYKIAKEFMDEKIRVQGDNILDISVEDYLGLSKIHQDKLVGYREIIHFEDKDVLMEPYLVGYSLKDEVPILYKCNSRIKRFELLAGYIDAKGYLNKKNEFEVIETMENDKLVDDIMYVARSVGLNVRKCVLRGEKTIKLCIDGWGIEDIAMLLRNKRVNIRNKQNKLSSRIRVEEIGVGEYYGIELDGNHRYVLGNFIVTHNSGKSWLVRDIFYHHKDIPIGLIFSGTEEANPFFGDFVPDSFIHSEYDPDLVNKMLVKQSQKVKQARNNGHADVDGLIQSNRAFVVLDDMLHDAAAWKKEKTIQSIFFNGRHYNIFFILTMQYPLGIPPALRSNIDYVFVFNEPSIKNRKKIYDDYGGCVPSFDGFCNILDSCTQNHECLVIKTSGNSSDLRDQLFWYKASKHDQFRVGHPKIWKYHDMYYNDKYDTQRDEEKEEIDKLKKKFAKTRKLKIIVNRQGEALEAIEESE